jgi:hypothetical protein
MRAQPPMLPSKSFRITERDCYKWALDRGPEICCGKIETEKQDIPTLPSSPCNPYVNRRFGGKCHVHVQGGKSVEQETSLQQMARQELRSSETSVHIRPYTSEDGNICITHVRTSNPIRKYTMKILRSPGGDRIWVGLPSALRCLTSGSQQQYM